MGNTRLMVALELFAHEVLSKLGTLQELDDFNQRMSDDMAALYLSQRLLSKQTWLSPKLDMVRKIASRLALDDVDSRATYPTYIEALSSLLVRQRKFRMMLWFRKPPMYCFPRKYGEREFNCDLLAAAVYTGQDAIVRELSEETDMLHFAFDWEGVMRNVYTAAAMRGDFTIICYLLDKAECQPRKLHFLMRTRIFPYAYRFGSPTLVEQLLASMWHPEWTHASRGFLRSCVTPNVENMNLVESFMKRIPDAHWRESELGTLLHTAAFNGWDDMAGHLLEKGAPFNRIELYNHLSPPFVGACQRGAEGVVRQLLRRGAAHERAAGEAAKKGFLGIVKRIVEGGIDANMPASLVGEGNRMAEITIVNVLMIEHTEMFAWLVEHGAKLEGLKSRMAKRKAKQEGLDSMVALLESMELPRT